MPFPICDGDNVGQAAHVRDVKAFVIFDDIDFVLLGCDEPDDPDDSPVDEDPEDGEFIFGPSNRHQGTDLPIAPLWSHRSLHHPIHIGGGTGLQTAARSSLPNISLASAFLSPSSAVRQSSLATMCC